MQVIDLARYGPAVELWPRRRLLLQTDDGPTLFVLPSGKMVVSKAGRRKSIVFGSAGRSTVQLLGEQTLIDAMAEAIIQMERPGIGRQTRTWKQR